MLLEEGAVTNALCTAFVCKHCNSGKNSSKPRAVQRFVHVSHSGL